MQSTPSIDIPHCFKDVTATWLSSVIGANLEGVEVVSCELVPIKQTKQNKVRVGVQYNGVGQKRALPTLWS